MIEVMTQEVQTNGFKDAVSNLITVSTGQDIGKTCPSTYPLCDGFIRKVKKC